MPPYLPPCLPPQPWPDYNAFNLSRSEDMVQFHLNSVNEQLARAYHGFAIALALNRTMVFPTVGADCLWCWLAGQTLPDAAINIS